ncbi:glycosyltransferase family 2 protein [Brevundimonas sp.]|uniref:glycosyltransferase family 2 protein n=1 Tax=Brevundimonas sp. TaxID=1871086 RepID=UPI003BAB1B48
MRDVAIIVPTMRRPESLARALGSLFAQTGVENRLAAIVVVDNDPQATAEPVIAALRAASPAPLILVHEPRPGVATARNTGLAATDAPLIAFLDDDEAADANWLSALLAGLDHTGADVVFGPIRGQVPEGTGWTRGYLERFFGRQGPSETGLLDHAYGCGNSLMKRATALPGPAPFDAASDQSGGEDDVLFSALAARGGRFGWAADAWVDEFAPSHRATMKYALARAFAYGQGPSQTAARDRRWGGVARWMLIGAAQTAVWGAASLGLTLIFSPRRAETLDRTARGIGKVLWMRGLEPHFYGARELARLSKA